MGGNVLVVVVAVFDACIWTYNLFLLWSLLLQ
jgi:hypothetical protein